MGHILFLTQVLPYPLHSGAKVRQYYVLRHLSQRHAVTLISFVRPDDRPEYVAHLREFCAAVYPVPMERSAWRNALAVLKGLATAMPFVILRDDIRAMRIKINQVLQAQPVDVIHADQESMAQYGLMGNGVGRVLDLHNAMYLVTSRLAQQEPNLARRWVELRETSALARYERMLATRFDQVVFVSDEDRRAIEVLPQRAGTPATRGSASAEDARHTTIPICVDPTQKPMVTPVPQPYRVLFLGPLFWPPNAEGVLWFAREVWPQVHLSHPQACFTVVGKNPPALVRALDGRNGIRVTGYLPDLAQVLAETAVFVVPLRAGGGMRVKILDAWCWGLPIVSTHIGAEGIRLQDGQTLLLANTAGAFAQAVSKLLGDASLQQRLSRAGRTWVEQTYDWRRVYAAWDTVYERVLSHKPA